MAHLRSVDAQETAALLFNLVGWTYLYMRTGHRWSPERSRPVIPVALEGLAAEHG